MAAFDNWAKVKKNIRNTFGEKLYLIVRISLLKAPYPLNR